MYETEQGEGEEDMDKGFNTKTERDDQRRKDAVQHKVGGLRELKGMGNYGTGKIETEDGKAMAN